MGDHTVRTLGWVKWECDRCHRDVVQEGIEVKAYWPFFDIRCPLCDKLVRFVMPSIRALDDLKPEQSMSLVRSSVEPIEIH